MTDPREQGPDNERTSAVWLVLLALAIVVAVVAS